MAKWNCRRRFGGSAIARAISGWLLIVGLALWGVGQSQAAPSVTISEFSATSLDDTIEVVWETTAEWNTEGFNVYRGTEAVAPGTPLNPQLIRARGAGSGAGFRYEWDDEDVEGGTTYYYWLEDIDTGGTRTIHGPVGVMHQAPSAVALDTLAAAPAPPAWPLVAPLIALGALALRHATRRR